ncbi:MAG: hypothetical protein IJ786_00200 [Bacteroidaceae bacterium]|nr:hypothetical protein [Bacteroidaceae bacterium]
MKRLTTFLHEHPRLSALIGVLLAAVVAIGVWLIVQHQSNDGLPPAEEPSDTGALRVSLLPVSECLPLYVAEVTGINDSLGLRAVIDHRRSAFDADTAVYGRSAHVAYSDLVRVLYQNTRGQHATVIMGLQGIWGVVGKPTMRSANLKEQKDQLIGVARYEASDLYGLEALKHVGLGYEDMLRVQANDYGVRANMVLQSQIEAAVLPEPFLSYAQGQKAKSLFVVPQSESKEGCLIVQPKALQSKRRAAQIARLVEGYNLAVDRINRVGLQGCDTLISRLYQIPVETLQKAKRPRYTHAALPTSHALTASRTFLSERGVRLANTLSMDDRFVKTK